MQFTYETRGTCCRIINFEVEAIDYEDAQRKVDDLLSVTSVPPAYTNLFVDVL